MSEKQNFSILLYLSAELVTLYQLVKSSIELKQRFLKFFSFMKNSTSAAMSVTDLKYHCEQDCLRNPGQGIIVQRGKLVKGYSKIYKNHYLQSQQRKNYKVLRFLKYTKKINLIQVIKGEQLFVPIQYPLSFAKMLLDKQSEKTVKYFTLSEIYNNSGSSILVSNLQSFKFGQEIYDQQLIRIKPQSGKSKFFGDQEYEFSISFEQEIFIDGDFIYNNKTKQIRCYKSNLIGNWQDIQDQNKIDIILKFLECIGYYKIFIWGIEYFIKLYKQLDNSSENQKIEKVYVESNIQSYVCLKCNIAERNVILLPCYHLAICDGCYEGRDQKLSICPICLKKVQKSLKIFKN